MERFEYKVLFENPKGLSGRIDVKNFERDLNDLGNEGWELVSADENSIGGGVFLVFKRKKN